jgi:hypothetical protein
VVDGDKIAIRSVINLASPSTIVIDGALPVSGRVEILRIRANEGLIVRSSFRKDHCKLIMALVS